MFERNLKAKASSFEFPRALEMSTKKVNKTVALLRKFQDILPRSALLTIYKCFVGTHLDYGDIIYDQAFSNSFHQKIYQGLGLESLQQRRPSWAKLQISILTF